MQTLLWNKGGEQTRAQEELQPQKFPEALAEGRRNRSERHLDGWNDQNVKPEVPPPHTLSWPGPLLELYKRTTPFSSSSHR